jgi:hypothetical protein
MLQRITNHPVFSAAWAVSVFLGTIGGAWYFFTSEAPGPALYRLGLWLVSMNLVALGVIAAGLLVPIFVVGLIAFSAARSVTERLNAATEERLKPGHAVGALSIV